jgi:hypothetical protein
VARLVGLIGPEEAQRVLSAFWSTLTPIQQLGLTLRMEFDEQRAETFTAFLSRRLANGRCESCGAPTLRLDARP